MTKENEDILSEQDLSEGELIDQEPFEPIDDPAVRLAGYNQIPDFGEDIKGTLQENEPYFKDAENQ